MPRSQRHRIANALRVLGASVALALMAAGVAPVAAASQTSLVFQQLPIASRGPALEGETHVSAPRRTDETDETRQLMRRAASVRVAAALLVGTDQPVSPDPSGAVVQVVVRTAAEQSPAADQVRADIDATLVEMQGALAAHDLASGQRLLLHAERAILVTALQVSEHAVESSVPDRAARPDSELVENLDRAARLARLTAAARSVEPSARYAAEARDLAAALHSIAESDRDTHEPALDLSPRSTDGYANGMIPLDVLCPVSFAPGHRLRCDAADALDLMNAAFRAALGTNLTLTDSYRTLDGQFAVRAAKPLLAALPGTSNHGWGLAVDLGGGVESYGSQQYAWLTSHAAEYGWHHPAYMNQDGPGPHEPWHWEFGTTDRHPSARSRHVERPPMAPAILTEPPAPTAVPSSVPDPVPDPGPPVVVDAQPIEAPSAVLPVPPAVLEPVLPTPVSDEPEDVTPACDAQTIPDSSTLPPLPSDPAPEADGASSPASVPPADAVELPAVIDEPPLPACPSELDSTVGEIVEPTSISAAEAAKPAGS